MGDVPVSVAQTTADEGRRGLTGLALVLAVAIGYSLLHSIFRLLASNVLGEDDVVDIVLAQDLRAGYDAFPMQPPLYDWVLWAVLHVTGPRIEAFLLIKYGALTATAVFLYLAARRALGDRLFALLTVESMALIYQIAWRYHEGFTHQVGAMVAVAATLWLVLRIVQDGGRLVDFLLLGVVAGLGLLTEWSYLAFLVALLAACLLSAGLRRGIARWPLILSLCVAVVIASPYLAWIAADADRLARLLRSVTPHLPRGHDGLLDALRGPIAYLSPLIFILPILFPRWLPTAWADLTRPRGGAERPGAAERAVLDALLIAFGMSMAGALLFGVEGFAIHDLMPLYLGSVIWLFGVAKRSSSGARQALSVAWLGRLALAIAVVALTARLANMFILDPVCKKCRWGIPYAELGEEMRKRGFDGTGTIVSVDRELAGNLRVVFPDAKVVARRYPHFTPEGAMSGSGSVAFVWGVDIPDASAQQYMEQDLGAARAADAETVTVGWRHLWRDTGWRTSQWRVLVVDPAAGAQN